MTGKAFCVVEMSHGLATMIEGDFYATPEPRVVMKDASESRWEDRRRFGSERLSRWSRP